MRRLPRRLDGRREGPTRRGLDDERRRRAAFSLGQGGREDFEGVFTGPEAEAGIPTSMEAQTRQQAETVELAHSAGDARTLIGYRGFRMLGFVGGSSDAVFTI